MKAAAIVGLVMLCGWLVAQLMGANRDKQDLQKRIDHLKRQILLLR